MSIWTRALAAAGLLCALSAGCKKDSESKEKEEEKTDDEAPLDEDAPEEPASLWKLAPPEAKAGLVMRAGALARIAAGIETLRDGYERMPGAKSQLEELESELESPGGVSLLAPEKWDDIGIDLSGPAAGFFFDDGGVLVLPITDRDAFVEAIGATREGEGEDRLDRFEEGVCKKLDGRYLCASEEELFARVGEGGDLAAAGKERPPELRGDVEAELVMEPDEAKFRRVKTALRLERGAATVRLRIGLDAGIPPLFSTEPRDLVQTMSEAEPAGFIRIHLALGLAAMQAPDSPTPFGASAKELIGALTGEIVAYILAGDPPSGYIRVGVSDTEMYAAVVNKVCAVISGQAPGMETKLEDDHCKGSLDPAEIARESGEDLGALPFDELEFDISVEDGAVVAALNAPEKHGRAAGPKSAAGRALMREAWNLAFWGAGGLTPETVEPLQKLPDDMEEAATTVSWILLHLSELGLGVRVEGGEVDILVRLGTQWSNPDEVLAELEPLLARAADGEDVISEFEALAKEHPDTPLGRSLSGGSGLVPVAAGTGIAAAVAIPAFVKYTKKAKASEAQMFVRKMYAGARTYYLDQSYGRTSAEPAKPQFPRPSAGPVPPKGACCSGEESKCAPDAAQWTSPTWTALQFSINDPHYYSYEYTVAEDGESFTVSAYGDLDCDGEYSTFRMIGEAGPDGPRGDALLERIQETE